MADNINKLNKLNKPDCTGYHVLYRFINNIQTQEDLNKYGKKLSEEDFNEDKKSMEKAYTYALGLTVAIQNKRADLHLN